MNCQMVQIFEDVHVALKGFLRDGITIMVGGFGLCGIPENAIRAIYESEVKGLTIISNNFGTADSGLGMLLKKKQVKRLISSYPGGNELLVQAVNNNEIEVVLVPQGTLAEAIRCGGAGIPAFYTRAGVGTTLGEGKETKEFDGRTYIMERSLTADLGLIKGWKSDDYGNIVYHRTARNFNPLIATAARHTIAEVEEIVKAGEIDPEAIHTPGIFVQGLVKGAVFEKRIEYITVKHG